MDAWQFVKTVFTSRLHGWTEFVSMQNHLRAKVEHTIGAIKRVFGFSKVRYRGLEKNAQRLKPGPDGIRLKGGVNLDQALAWNGTTCRRDAKGMGRAAIP